MFRRNPTLERVGYFHKVPPGQSIESSIGIIFAPHFQSRLLSVDGSNILSPAAFEKDRFRQSRERRLRNGRRAAPRSCKFPPPHAHRRIRGHGPARRSTVFRQAPGETAPAFHSIARETLPRS